MPVILGLAAALLGLIGQVMRSHERVLDERGVSGFAEVVEADDRGRRIDEVVVDYRAGGVSYRTHLPVISAGDFQVGSTIAIRYDPSQPDHARPLEGWLPSYRLLLTGAAATGVGAAVSALRAPRMLRTDREAATSGMETTMWGAPYRRVRWRTIEIAVTQFVGLWPQGGDRGRGAPLSVKLSPGFELRRRGPVTVVGRPEPGSHVVLLVDGQAVWTTGAIVEGLDPEAEPVTPP